MRHGHRDAEVARSFDKVCQLEFDADPFCVPNQDGSKFVRPPTELLVVDGTGPGAEARPIQPMRDIRVMGPGHHDDDDSDPGCGAAAGLLASPMLVVVLSGRGALAAAVARCANRAPPPGGPGRGRGRRRTASNSECQ